jgi:hypothetical protein
MSSGLTAKLWRLANQDKIKGYRQRHKERQKELKRVWGKTPRGQRYIKRKHDSRYRRIRHEILARKKLRYHVYHGHIKKLPCEKCRDPKSQGHRDDYSKPLTVRWLCQKHHQEVHQKIID